MANTKRVRILVRAGSDGSSNTIQVDLQSDPYWIGEQSAGYAFGGSLMNYDPKKTPPTAVEVIDGADSASISGTVITIIVDAKPRGELFNVVLALVYP